jgi:molybdate transport system substrate-binding protein
VVPTLPLPRARGLRRLAGRTLLAVAALACGALAGAAPARAQPASPGGTEPLVAAASDLKFALEEIAARYRADTGRGVRLAFGASGNLARQIEQGAPFELFLSADEALVQRLADKGLTRDAGTLYAIGRLALLVPEGSPLAADGTLKDLAAALKDGRLQRFAIAQPEHAPYGKRAEEALRHAGLWDAIRPRLVYGENVAQAAQYATGGSAQGGLVAHSLALSPPLARRSKHALVPQEWHSPLRQRIVLLRRAGDAARAFHDYLGTPRAREVMRAHGFTLPEGR